MIDFPMPFSAYLEHALYGDDGYYMADRNRFGRSGDFYTSAQVSPLYGALWARFIVDRSCATALSVIELGCGDGDFAVSMISEWLRIRADEMCPIVYSAIDLSEVARERTKERLERLLQEVKRSHAITVHVVASVEQLELTRDSSMQTGWIIGNEVLDAIPCEVVRVNRESEVWRLMVTKHGMLQDGVLRGPFQGKYYETYFESVTSGALREYALRYFSPILKEQESEVIIAEAHVGLTHFFRDLMTHIQPTYFAFIDYGGLTRDVVGEDRPNGSLRAYHAHQVLDTWLDRAGEVDITYDVDFSVVENVLSDVGYEMEFIERQGAFLMSVEALEDVYKTMQQTDLNLSQKLKQLVMPGALGDRFFVLLARRRPNL